MSEDAKLQESIKKTQDLLSKYIKKPPLTEKLLKKPPFRFLHDIINAIIKETGFLKGLFTDEELDSSNITDKEGKLAYLTKLIDAMKLITGQELSVRPSKIVSGQDPIKTNELLQLIGKSLDKKVSSSEAIEHYKKSVEKKEKSKKSDEKSRKSSSEEKLKKFRETEEKRKPSGSDDKPRKDEEKLRKSSKKSNQSERTRSKDRIKEDKEVKKKKSREDSAERKSKKNDSEHSRKSKRSSSPKLEKNRKKGSEEISKKGHEENSKKGSEEISKKGLDEISKKGLDEISKKGSEEILKKGSEEILKKGSEEILKKGSEEISKKGHEEISKTGLDEISKKCFEEMSKKGHEEISKKGLEDTESIHEEKLPSKGPPEDLQEDLLPKKNLLRPPSVRPPSARPGAPKIKGKGDFTINPNSLTQMGDVHVIVENFDTKEDDAEGMVIMETSGADDNLIGNSDLLNKELTKEHGYLVAQILETQRELVNEGNVEIIPNKVEIEWDPGMKKDKEIVVKEVDRLRGTIQTLTRTTNPLGKLMDFLQEDAEVMEKELWEWRSQFSDLREQLVVERNLMKESIKPLEESLKEIEGSIKGQMEKIFQTKANIMRNGMKIQKLLSGR